VKLGNVLIGVGLVLLVLGFAANRGWLSWFGRLPGDIRSEGDRGGFYFPITSSIIVSVVLTIIVNVVVRWFRDR
jgi:hypothetical protein